MESSAPGDYPALAQLTATLLEVWPEHEPVLDKSLPREPSGELDHARKVAEMIASLAGSEARSFCEDYRWTCEKLLEEELFFRRHGRYRLSSFAEAAEEVYDDPAFMERYVNGLLLSHLFWANHRQVLMFFEDEFLPGLPSGFRHLEVGPGHGLYLALAAANPDCAEAMGWDVSETSIRHTRDCVDCLGAGENIRVEKQDILALPSSVSRFDSIVMSEVLEHLEQPTLALRNARDLLAPGGRIFVNVPVNSPAPDHIYLLGTTDEAVDLVTGGGFRVLEAGFYPAGGYSFDRAVKNSTTISCAIIATPES